ncbi:MAG: hypothetical protein U0P82_15265 [Vicinamibacterales bacterium]
METTTPELLTLSNGVVEIGVPTDRGPRVLHYAMAGGSNVLAHTPALFTDTRLGRWQPTGGHRLWVAPERMPGSYAPDDRPVRVTSRSDRDVLLEADVDASGIEKSLGIALAPSGTGVTLTHRITNRTCWPVRVAPWAITIVDPAATAVLPQPTWRSHAEQLVPERRLVQWAYTDFTDPRWRFGPSLITLTPDAARPGAQKIGAADAHGWAAALGPGWVFIKLFGWEPTAEYPDLGCNAEVFTAADYLEVESLAPLTIVEPDASLSHIERWLLLPAPEGDLSEPALATWLNGAARQQPS